MLQDCQKQILKMTEGEELAPIFKPKKTTKTKTKQDD